jgi:hypothetical protein
MIDDRPVRIVSFNVEGLLRKPDRTTPMQTELCDKLADVLVAFCNANNVKYDSLVGWCLRIDAAEDAFVRRSP